MHRRAVALALLPIATLLAATGITLAVAASAHRHATLHTGVGHVGFGDRFHLHGAVPGTADAPVTISFNPAGKRRDWRPLGHRVTDADGTFSFLSKAHMTGIYRAKPAQGQASPHVRVPVRSVTRARATSHAIVGHGVPIVGRVRPGDRGRRVAVLVGGQTLHTRTSHDGRFRVRWRAGDTGRRAVRAKAGRDEIARSSHDGAGHLTVFRPAQASWYGPGFYGGRTACGRTLEPGTLGVANKTLPCGSDVTLRYGSRQVTVPVIDRGPYVAGRDYDLTQATKERLRFGSTGTVLSSK